MKKRIALAEFLGALEEATIADLEFSEEEINSHSSLKEKKTGCRLVAVKKTVVPDPGRIVYVRAARSNGNHWYVLDHSVAGMQGYEEITASSENEAKEIGFRRLRDVYVRMRGHPEFPSPSGN